MATIYYEHDADPAALQSAQVAIVGYGNQGRSWALNLRDSGVDVRVCVRADETREQARADGFDAGEIADADAADVVCLLVPDDAIPSLPIHPRDDALVVVASGYTLAFDRLQVPGDAGMVAPRMLGPEVRRCYEEGVGFVTAVGVHQDRTGTALARTLALARAVGGLRQGGIELTVREETVLDLAVEQILAPALRHVHTSFVRALLERGLPIDAILTELLLSGETERTMRLTRLEGYATQMEHHSPTSQYGQLSRDERYAGIDLLPTMRASLDEIESGAFADEWDAERDAGYPHLRELKETAVGPAVQAFERDLRSRIGELVAVPDVAAS